MTESRKHLSPRETPRTVMVGLPQVLQGEAKTWGPELARRMRKARHELDHMPSQAREYLGPILEGGRRALREESASALSREAKAQGKGFSREAMTDEERAVWVGRHLMEISEELARLFEAPVQHVHEYVLHVEELLRHHPHELRMREEKEA